MRYSKEDIENIKLEAVRQAEMAREDLDLNDEFDAAIYSVWAVMNSLCVRKRDSVGNAEFCSIKTDDDPAYCVRFTAHSHRAEPLCESPDDMLIFSRLTRNGRKFMHFIIDKFRIIRIK